MPDDPRPRRSAATGSPEAAPRAALLLGQLTGRRGPAPGVAQDRRAAADRRRHSAWSFVYGGLRPRRRSGRRAGDEHRVFLDWHEPRVLYIVLAIVLMSCADALFTLNLLAVGGEELNAFMRVLLGRDVAWFLWAKIGMTCLSIVVLVVVSRRLFLRRVPVMWLIRLFFLGYVALIGWEIYLLGWHATTAGDAAVDELARWVAG